MFPSELLERYYGRYSLSAKAGVVLTTYEGTKVDWGTVTRVTLREGLHAFQDRKKLRSILQQYVTILFAPRALPAPAPKPSRRRIEQLATSTWEQGQHGLTTLPNPAFSMALRIPANCPIIHTHIGTNTKERTTRKPATKT